VVPDEGTWTSFWLNGSLEFLDEKDRRTDVVEPLIDFDAGRKGYA
jgi:hypothetical protein